jgi:hypothetical protein
LTTSPTEFQQIFRWIEDFLKNYHKYETAFIREKRHLDVQPVICGPDDAVLWVIHPNDSQDLHLANRPASPDTQFWPLLDT